MTGWDTAKHPKLFAQQLRLSPADTITLRPKQGSQSKRDTETVKMEEVVSGWESKGFCRQRKKEPEAPIQETAEGCEAIRKAGAKALG